MSKEYGLNLGYIALNKEKFNEIKSYFLENCTKEELFISIDDEEWLLDKLMYKEGINWILDSFSGRDVAEAFDWFIMNSDKLLPRQLEDLKEDLSSYNSCLFLPTDNLLDLSKAEFIIENWDKIKIENIKI